MTKTSRRAAGKAVPDADPVFALIAAHEQARAAIKAVSGGPKDIPDDLIELEDAAWLAFVEHDPVTLPGLRAYARHVATHSELATLEKEGAETALLTIADGLDRLLPTEGDDSDRHPKPGSYKALYQDLESGFIDLFYQSIVYSEYVERQFSFDQAEAKGEYFVFTLSREEVETLDYLKVHTEGMIRALRARYYAGFDKAEPPAPKGSDNG